MRPHVQSAVPSCAIITQGDAGRGREASGDFLWCMQGTAFLQAPLGKRSACVPCKGSPATCLSRDAITAPDLALSSQDCLLQTELIPAAGVTKGG